MPSKGPTGNPTDAPSIAPTMMPTTAPSNAPSVVPTAVPTVGPSVVPSAAPTTFPTFGPTDEPTVLPTKIPSQMPSGNPSDGPSLIPSMFPTHIPTEMPSNRMSTTGNGGDPIVINTENPVVSDVYQTGEVDQISTTLVEANDDDKKNRSNVWEDPFFIIIIVCASLIVCLVVIGVLYSRYHKKSARGKENAAVAVAVTNSNGTEGSTQKTEIEVQRTETKGKEHLKLETTAHVRTISGSVDLSESSQEKGSHEPAMPEVCCICTFVYFVRIIVWYVCKSYIGVSYIISLHI